MTTVAAIIPTRDRAELTLRAVASVLSQTRPPDELIVVDDGSRDDTVDGLRARYPATRVLQLDGRGVSAARNAGIGAATSEWLAFLDSDDEWLPEKLQIQLEALTAESEYRLCHSDEIWIRNGRRVNPGLRHRKQGGYMFRQCLPLCAISPSSVVVHRSVFDEFGLFDETLPACEDYDLWLRVCSRWPVLLVNRPLLRKYGGHADQLSRTPALDRYRIRALVKILDAGVLTADDLQATLEVLTDKLRVYLGGARKRQRWSEVRELEGVAERFGLLAGNGQGRTDPA